MKRYPIRAAKYFLFLFVAYCVIYFAMLFTGTTNIQLDTMNLFLTSKSGMVMLAMLLLLSFTHPFFGYVKRNIGVNIDDEDKVVKIEEAINVYGFTKTETSGELIIFRPESILKRIMMLYEDKIVFNTKEGTLEGNRKEITRLIFRIQTQLINH